MECGRTLQYVATGAVSMLMLTMGMTNSWATPMVSKLLLNKTSISFTEDQYSIVANIISPIGYYIGVVGTGCVSDRLGRRPVILSSAILFLCGTIFSASANSAWMIFTMQAFESVATGIGLIVVNVYVAEIAEKEARGGLITASRNMFHLGTLLTVWLGSWATYRKFNIWLVVAPLFTLAFLYPIPESPYFLLKVGKIEKARKALWRLQENALMEDDIEILLNKMNSEVKKEMQDSKSIIKFNLFRWKYFKALLIIFGLEIIYFMSGSISIHLYIYDILRESDIDKTWHSVFITFTVIKFSIGLLAAVMVDWIGRRRLLIWSFIGSCLSMASVATYYSLRELAFMKDFIGKNYGIMVYIGFLFFVITSSFGYESIKDVIAAEIFPINVRISAMVAVKLSGSLTFPAFIIIRFVKDKGDLWGVFWLYAGFKLVGAIFTYFLVPETKRKNLSEIQEMLQSQSTENEQEMRSTTVRP